jgi:hypothetical protein
LVKKYSQVPQVIFHCALSQVRGPRSAGMYHRAASRATEANTSEIIQQVFVLRGGFALWQARFKDQEGMIENYDPELWEAEY